MKQNKENNFHTINGWVEYLTVSNYFTFNQIENRKKTIDSSGCDYIEIVAKIKSYRSKNRKLIFESNGKSFYITETHKLKENIEGIKEFWKSIEYNFQDKFDFELLKDTLIEEGYYSSTIEGAHSTVKRAITLAKGRNEPKNKSEYMVLNNFKALTELKDKTDELSHKIIKNIHSITVENTLDDTYNIGQYRTEPNKIINANGKVIFTPIANIESMHDMLDELIVFLKDDKLSTPIDHIYKAISFHFLFAYIHPFDDGNGRTVRVLFTYLLKYYGYDMFYYISLSEIIYNKKAKDYYQSFLDVERSFNNSKTEYDMTYFFYYMSDVMLKGLDVLKTRINTYLREDIVKAYASREQIDLIPRQEKIIKILSNPKKSFLLTSADLAQKCSVNVRTIQRDLKLLIDFNLVERVKAPNSRKYYFKLNMSVL